MKSKELQKMKKQTKKAQPTSLINEEFDKTVKLGMTEMEAQARIARLMSTEPNLTKSAKTSTSKKQVSHQKNLRITALGDPIV